MYLFKGFLLSLFLFSATSMASIVNVDWKEKDDDALVYDNETGNAWLALTETAGLTLREVKTQMDGGRFDGMRFATQNEFITLLSNMFDTMVLSDTHDYFEIAPSESQVFIDLFGEMSDSVFDVPNAVNMSMGMIVDGDKWYVGGRYKESLPRVYNGTGERSWEGEDVSRFGFGYFLISDGFNSNELNDVPLPWASLSLLILVPIIALRKSNY